jgi:Spy/CpxP family protein refolding chaperone
MTHAGEVVPPGNRSNRPDTAPAPGLRVRIVVFLSYRRPPLTGRRFPMIPRSWFRKLFARPAAGPTRPGPKGAVMRTLIAVVVPAMGVLMYAALPAAAQQGSAEKAGEGLAARLQDLDLTDEQEAKIIDIRKGHRPKVQEAASKLAAVVKEEVDRVRGVLTPEQRTKLEAARDERQEVRPEGLAERVGHLGELDLTDDEVARVQEIHKDFRPRMEKVLKELQGLLTDDQNKARQEALRAGKKRREVLEALKLTDEQKQKVQAIGKEVAALARERMEKVSGVLSAGQKEELPDLKEERKERVRDRMAHRIANLKDLNLTEDQKAQIADIRKGYRPKVQEAGNKLRATIRDEIEEIVAVIKG